MFPELPPEAWAALEAHQGNPALWPMLALRAAGFNDAAELLELGKHVEAVRASGATNGAE